MNNRMLILMILGFTLFSTLIFYPIYQQFAHAQTRTNDVMEVEIPPDDIAPLVSSLTDQWSSSLLVSGGWLHVEELHLREMETAGVLPNGDPIPLDYINDSWYYLNADGLVEQAVVLMKTVEGEVFQESIFSDGAWTNLTTEDFFEREPFLLNLDFGFGEDISTGIASYDEITAKQVTYSDGWLLSIIARDDYGGVIDLAGISAPILSIEHRGSFNGETGALLSLSTVGIDENGREYDLEVVSYLSLEHVDPPAEIRFYLSEVTQ